MSSPAAPHRASGTAVSRGLRKLPSGGRVSPDTRGCPMTHKLLLRSRSAPQTTAQLSRENDRSAAIIDLAIAFSEAMALHRGGRLAEAEIGSRKILELKPDHFARQHLLGVLHPQRGRHA